VVYLRYKRKRKGDRTMTIYGLNKKATKGLYIVYTVTEGRKYFLSAWRTEEEANKRAEKYFGKVWKNY